MLLPMPCPISSFAVTTCTLDRNTIQPNSYLPTGFRTGAPPILAVYGRVQLNQRICRRRETHTNCWWIRDYGGIRVSGYSERAVISEERQMSPTWAGLSSGGEYWREDGRGCVELMKKCFICNLIQKKGIERQLKISLIKFI